MPSDYKAIPKTAEVLTPSTIPMVEVVAPSTLPEGYEFQANIDENTVVTVVVVSMHIGKKSMT